MTHSDNPRRSRRKRGGSARRSRARDVRVSAEPSRTRKRGAGVAEPQHSGIISLLPHHYPSRNGATPNNAPMMPAEGPSLPHHDRDQPSAPFMSRLPLAVAAAGASCLGFIATAGHLWSGAPLFPHRLRALLAALSTVLLWTLCARIAPSLGKPQSKGRRFLGITLFLLGTVCLLAALQTAKFAVAYLSSGFGVLLGLSVFLTAHLFALTRGRLDLYLIAVFGWSTLLGALSIALLLGDWDPGSVIVAVGYGALCVAIALSSWHPPSRRPVVTVYSLLVLFGCISLPAVTIISGLPPQYLVTYLILWPAVRHLRRVSSTAKLPPPRQPLVMNLCYLGLLAVVSVISSQVAPAPSSVRPETPSLIQQPSDPVP